MEINWTQVIGIVAAICTTGAFLPQAIKTFKTKDTKGISILMYSFSTLGIFLWLVYGLLLHDTPLILANSITVLLCGSILILKIKHG